MYLQQTNKSSLSDVGKVQTWFLWLPLYLPICNITQLICKCQFPTSLSSLLHQSLTRRCSWIPEISLLHSGKSILPSSSLNRFESVSVQPQWQKRDTATSWSLKNHRRRQRGDTGIWIIWCTIAILDYYLIPRPPKFCMASSFLDLANFCGQREIYGRSFVFFPPKLIIKMNKTVVAGVNFWAWVKAEDREASSDTSSEFTASWPQVITVNTMTRISLLWKTVLWKAGRQNLKKKKTHKIWSHTAVMSARLRYLSQSGQDDAFLGAACGVLETNWSHILAKKHQN